MNPIEEYYENSGEAWRRQCLADFLCWCCQTRRHPYSLIEQAANRAWFEVEIGPMPPLVGFMNLPGLPGASERDAAPPRPEVSEHAGHFAGLLRTLGRETDGTAIDVLTQAFEELESSDDLQEVIGDANSLTLTYFMR